MAGGGGVMIGCPVTTPVVPEVMASWGGLAAPATDGGSGVRGNGVGIKGPISCNCCGGLI